MDSSFWLLKKFVWVRHDLSLVGCFAPTGRYIDGSLGIKAALLESGGVHSRVILRRKKKAPTHPDQTAPTKSHSHRENTDPSLGYG